jgi:hypothetical protein
MLCMCSLQAHALTCQHGQLNPSGTPLASPAGAEYLTSDFFQTGFQMPIWKKHSSDRGVTGKVLRSCRRSERACSSWIALINAEGCECFGCELRRSQTHAHTSLV